MNLVLDKIVIRDFQRKDALQLYRIVRESEIIRFMNDWAENASAPEDYYGFIDWLQTKKRFRRCLRKQKKRNCFAGNGRADRHDRYGA